MKALYVKLADNDYAALKALAGDVGGIERRPVSVSEVVRRLIRDADVICVAFPPKLALKRGKVA